MLSRNFHKLLCIPWLFKNRDKSSLILIHYQKYTKWLEFYLYEVKSFIALLKSYWGYWAIQPLWDMIRTFYGYNGSDRFGRIPIAKNLQTDIASEPKFEMDRIFNIIPPKVNTIIKYLYLAHGVDKVLADIYLVYAMSLASERSFCIRFMRTFSHSRGHFKSILPFLFFFISSSLFTFSRSYFIHLFSSSSLSALFALTLLMNINHFHSEIRLFSFS